MKSRKSPVNILSQLSMNNPRSRQSKNILLQSATTSVKGSAKISSYAGKSTAEKVHNLTNNIQGKNSFKGSNLALNSARIRPHEM